MQLIDKIIWRVVNAVILLAVVSMVVLISVQVVSRFAGHSVTWTEELARFLFIWTVWLGLAAGFRNGQHPALNFLVVLIPTAFRPFYRLIPVACAMVLFGVACWQGWNLLVQQISFDERSATLQIGMWLATLPLVIGAGLAILGTGLHALFAEDDFATPVDMDAGNQENPS